MPATGVQDLSIITDALLALIRTNVNAAALGFPVTVSGSMPESVRADGGCQVSFYLYYVAVDKTHRNSPAPGRQAARERALGLELYFLLSAFNNREYVQEQHAMSSAVRTLTDNPYLRIAGINEEMSVTLETEASDKLFLFWEAANAPLRLSTIFRVAAAFLRPPLDAVPTAPPPTSFTVAVDPTALPFSSSGQMVGTFARITFLTPDSTPANLAPRSYDLSPATVAPGQQMILYGAGLNRVAITDQVFLIDAAGNEVEITTWMSPVVTTHTPTRVTLLLPATVGAAPANTPDPGIYQVRAGSGAARTNSTPFSIAAAITGVANPPLITDVAGLFTFAGAGFVPGSTELLLDTIALTAVGGAPASGEFQIQAGGTGISFRSPTGLATGRYPLRVRVNQVESAPSWWIDV